MVCVKTPSNSLETIIKKGGKMVMETERSCEKWHWELNERSDKTVKEQILKGRNINERDSYGNTILHEVIRSVPGTSLARFLIQNGADVNAENLVFAISYS